VTAEERRARLDRALNLILIVVAVQFVLGIWVNLYSTFPSGNDAPSAALTSGHPWLVAHVAVGILLFLGAIGIVAQAWRDPFRPMRGFALGGLVAVLVAGFSGYAFVLSGYSNDAASFVMALGFVAIVTAYYEGLVALRSHPIPATVSAGT
jgi:heme A synthase